jgi:cation transport ATPase
MAVGIGTALAGIGINWVKDMIFDHGEDLVKEGIKKVTGVDLDKKKPQELTTEEIQKINDHELELNKLDFEKLKLEYDQRNKEEAEKTKRWESDNNSSSTFAKLVRPGVLVYLIIIISLMAFADGNISSFKIKDHWVSLFTNLTITVVGGYFTLRTYEKRTKTNKWR